MAASDVLLTAALVFIGGNIVLSQNYSSQSSTSTTTSAPIDHSKCGIPATDIRGVPLQPNRLTGTWYEYAFMTGNNSGINPVSFFTALRNVTNPAQSNFTILAAQWVDPTYGGAPGGPIDCFGIFHQANVTNEGFVFTETFFTIPGVPSPQFLRHINLYIDYDRIYIAYRCNGLVTGQQTDVHANCVDPYFWVYTRIVPPELPADTKSFISSQLDILLKPYCYSSKDLAPTQWNQSLPTCNPTPPAGFTAAVNAILNSPY